MRFLTAFSLLVTLPGCIGIYRGGDQGVWLLSDPPGAKVIIDGQEGITPCLKALDRDSHSVIVRYELDGRAPIEKAVEPRCNADLLVLEFFFDSLLGSIADCIAGNAYYWPLGIQAQLAPAGGTSTIVETWALPKTPEQRAIEAQGKKDKDEGRVPVWDRGYH